MLAESTVLPRWLLVGLLLGAVGSLAVAGLFVVAGRLFPAPRAAGPDASGGSRRRTELRAYLQTIDERYAEDHPVAGQEVAFYLPERDVAITFDARAYYRIDGSSTTPVLVEHEMPGAQLGARLPFETPDVSVGSAGRESDADATRRGDRRPTAAAFRELGVSTSATLDEIKAAYRRKVKEVHPDHGGDEEAFRRVREAYTTAKQHAAD